MAAVAIFRAGLNGQSTLERARAAMIACVLRMLHFHTPQPTKKRQLKCDLGTSGGVPVPARRLSWNFDLTARLEPWHSSCLCQYQEP